MNNQLQLINFFKHTCSLVSFGKNLKYHLNLKLLDSTSIKFKNLKIKILNYIKFKIDIHHPFN